MVTGGYTLEKYSVALPYKEGDIIMIMLNRSLSVQWNQTLMHACIYGPGKPELGIQVIYMM